MYETPHSLLDNISLGYRQVFLAHPFISPSLPSTWEVFVHLYHVQFHYFQAFGAHLSAKLEKLKERRESEAELSGTGTR